MGMQQHVRPSFHAQLGRERLFVDKNTAIDAIQYKATSCYVLVREWKRLSTPPANAFCTTFSNHDLVQYIPSIYQGTRNGVIYRHCCLKLGGLRKIMLVRVPRCSGGGGDGRHHQQKKRTRRGSPRGPPPSELETCSSRFITWRQATYCNCGRVSFPEITGCVAEDVQKGLSIPC